MIMSKVSCMWRSVMALNNKKNLEKKIILKSVTDHSSLDILEVLKEYFYCVNNTFLWPY